VEPKFNLDMSLYRIISNDDNREHPHMYAYQFCWSLRFLSMFLYNILGGLFQKEVRPQPVRPLFSKPKARRNFIQEVPNLVVLEIAVAHAYYCCLSQYYSSVVCRLCRWV
jgi:hypothetical protein